MRNVTQLLEKGMAQIHRVPVLNKVVRVDKAQIKYRHTLLAVTAALNLLQFRATKFYFLSI